MNKEKIEEIQILRAFAILAVINLHVSSNYLKIGVINNTALVNAIISQLLLFGVPLFTFISGFVLGLKYRENFSVLNFYKKRLKTLIPSYLLFFFIYILFENILLSSQLKTTRSPSPIIFKLLTGRSYGGHLWFIIFIIQLYLIYPAIRKSTLFLCSKRNALIVITAMFLFQIVWTTCSGGNILVRDPGILVRIIEVNCDKLFSYAAYFVFGIYLSDNKEAIKSKLQELKITKLALVISFLAAFVAGISIIDGQLHNGIIKLIVHRLSYISELLQLVQIICTITLLYKFASRLLETKNRFINYFIYLGEYALGIYLIHMLILLSIVLISEHIYSAYFNHAVFYLICSISTLFFSILFCRLINLLPYSEFIIGRNPGNIKE